MTKIAPSILSADFANLGRDIIHMTQAGADIVHIDVMDGTFVPNISLGLPIISAIRPYTDLPFDVHLMMINPEKYINDVREAGADYISVHVEATAHLHRVIQQIKESGAKAGVVVNPHTSVEQIKYVLSEVDYVLVMTVNPGFGGQVFIKEMLNKIKELNDYRQNHQLNFAIEVDGGINDSTAKLCREAGADWLIAGSYLFNSPDLAQGIESLRN